MASYYKCTPNRLFCFKWSKKDPTKVQPVYITHDKIGEHYPLLIDPPADSKWAEKIKGKVPPGYQGPQDLQPTSGKIEIESSSPNELASTLHKGVKAGKTFGPQDLVNTMSGQGFDVEAAAEKFGGLASALEKAFGKEWKADYAKALEDGLKPTSLGVGEVPPSKTEPEPEGPPDPEVVASKVLPSEAQVLVLGIDNKGIDNLSAEDEKKAKAAFGKDWEQRYHAAKATILAGQLVPLTATPNDVIPLEAVKAARDQFMEITGYDKKAAHHFLKTAWRMSQPPWQDVKKSLFNGLVSAHKHQENEHGILPIPEYPAKEIEVEPASTVPDPGTDPDDDVDVGPEAASLTGFSGEAKILFDFTNDVGFSALDEEDDEELGEALGGGWKNQAGALNFAFDAYAGVESDALAEKYGVEHDDIMKMFDLLGSVADNTQNAEGDFYASFSDATNGKYDSLAGLASLEPGVDKLENLPEEAGILLDTVDELGGIKAVWDDPEADELFSEHFGEDWKYMAAGLAMGKDLVDTIVPGAGQAALQTAFQQKADEYGITKDQAVMVYATAINIEGGHAQGTVEALTAYFKKGWEDAHPDKEKAFLTSLKQGVVVPISAGGAFSAVYAARAESFTGLDGGKKAMLPSTREQLKNHGVDLTTSEGRSKFAAFGLLDRVRIKGLGANASDAARKAMWSDPKKLIDDESLRRSGLPVDDELREGLHAAIKGILSTPDQTTKNAELNGLMNLVRVKRQEYSLALAEGVVSDLAADSGHEAHKIVERMKAAGGDPLQVDTSGLSLNWMDTYEGLAIAGLMQKEVPYAVPSSVSTYNRKIAAEALFTVSQQVALLSRSAYKFKKAAGVANAGLYAEYFSSRALDLKTGQFFGSVSSSTLKKYAEAAIIKGLPEKYQDAAYLAAYFDPKTGTFSGGVTTEQEMVDELGEDWKLLITGASLAVQLKAAVVAAEVMSAGSTSMANWLPSLKSQIKHAFGLKTLCSINGMMQAAKNGQVSVVMAKYKKAKKVPSHYMAALPTSQPAAGAASTTPASTPAPVPPVGFKIPDIPPASALTLGGSATELGGIKAKQYATDANQNKYLFKPEKVKGLASQAVSDLSSLLMTPGQFVPVKVCTIGGKVGAVQPMIANMGQVHSVGSSGMTMPQTPILQMSQDQLNDLLRERVLDWAVGNQDTKPDNFLKAGNGKIIGIDKEQAFKYIQSAKLEVGAQCAPNPTISLYDKLFSLYTKGKIDLDFNKAMLPYIKRVENIPNSKWMEAVDPYIDAWASSAGWTSSAKQSFRAAVLARKNGIRADFESFITKLRNERGISGAFKFEEGTAPSMGTSTSSLPVPAIQDLIPTQAPSAGATLPGAEFYEDAQGNRWMYTPSKGKTVHASLAGATASWMAKRVKDACPNVGSVQRMKGGKLETGTLAPWFEDTKGSLESKSPADLTEQQRVDIGAEHVADWCMGQSNTHAGNLMELEDGSIIGIDKGLGWQNMQTGTECLDVDWSPPGSTKPSYYSKFWKDWTDGKFDFDAKKLASAVESVEKVDAAEFTAKIRPFAEALHPGNKAKQETFMQAARARKNGIRRDFEVFLTGLHRKRYGTQDGVFSFKKGWVSGTSSSPQSQTYTQTYSSPDFLSVKTNGGYVKPFTGDASKLMIKVPQSATAEAQLKATLDEIGVTPVGDFISGQYNVVVPVNKADWDAASVTTTEVVTSSSNAPPILPHPGKPEYVAKNPPARSVPGNMDDLDKLIGDNTDWVNIGWGGVALTGDSDVVKNQTMRVRKCLDQSGKPYYAVDFRLRDGVQLSAPSKTHAVWTSPLSDFDEATGEFKDKSGSLKRLHSTARKWKVGNSEAYVLGKSAKVSTSASWTNAPKDGSGAELGNNHACVNKVRMQLRLKQGESFSDALGKMLTKMGGANFRKKVMRNPTEEELEKHRLMGMLWAYSPQESEKLKASDETVSGLKARLLAKGVTEKQLSRVEQAEIADGITGLVERGRWRDVKDSSGKPALRFFSWSLKSSAAHHVANILQSGMKGPNGRIFGGLSAAGESVEGDLNSGGADRITMRSHCSPHDDVSVSGYGGIGGGTSHAIQFVIAPDLADRLDLVQVTHDTYGKTTVSPSSLNATPDSSSWSRREPLPKGLMRVANQSANTSAEVVVGQSLGANYICRVNIKPTAYDAQGVRKQVIKTLRDAGMEEVNGVPVEDFVVIEGTVKGVYDKYVKPMGYS